MMNKNLEYYLNLDYEIEFDIVDDDCLASIPILGKYATCAVGKNKEEARQNLKFVLTRNVKSWLESGIVIPEP